MVVNGLVLAAGMSKRMQQFKPLMKISSKTMIETTVDQMLEAGVQQVVVVLGYRSKEVREVLLTSDMRKSRIRIAYNRNYEHSQMLESVKIGLRCMPFCDCFFITPGDMPAISTATYRKLCQRAENSNAKVVIPVLDGYRKHPPLISWNCKNDILQFRGKGLRELWKEYAEEILELPLDDRGCTMDADYQRDYQNICHYMQENILHLECRSFLS